jgi:hypothetical protein
LTRAGEGEIVVAGRYPRKGEAMSESALFVGFGAPTRGRERQAVGVFSEAVALYEHLRSEGMIDMYEPIFLEPHGGDLGGFFLLRGDAEKLAQVRMSDEFELLSTRASLVVDDFGVIGAVTGEGIQRQMSLYQAQLEQLAAPSPATV